MVFTIFGEVESPYEYSYWGITGMVFFLNNVLKLLFVVGGLLVLFNLVFAGFQFLNAGGDPKAIETAWNKIWQSLVGLLIIATSFLVAAIAGHILFGDATAILQPKLYGPGT